RIPKPPGDRVPARLIAHPELRVAEPLVDKMLEIGPHSRGVARREQHHPSPGPSPAGKAAVTMEVVEDERHESAGIRVDTPPAGSFVRIRRLVRMLAYEPRAIERKAKSQSRLDLPAIRKRTVALPFTHKIAYHRRVQSRRCTRPLCI